MGLDRWVKVNYRPLSQMVLLGVGITALIEH